MAARVKAWHRLVVSLTLIVGCGVISSSPLALAQSQTEAATINSFIAKQMGEEEATEYKKARLVARGDLDGDGSRDVAVIYTLEDAATNQYQQYLAVFIRRRGGLRYVTHESVGGKYQRAVNSVVVSGGKIILQTLEYLPTDGSCCPSIKAKARFVLNGTQLKEL